MEMTLLIVGAGGHGKVVFDVALAMNKWHQIWFVDDNKSIGQTCGCSKVIGNTLDIARLCKSLKADCFVAIGDNKARKNILCQLINNDINVPTLIHPSVIMGSGVNVGKGTVIMPGVTINTDSKIGVGCIINTSSSIDHDNEIGDYVHVSPGVKTAGAVVVGSESWLGIGSVISNNLKIVSNSIIGAGAVVIKNIDQPGTYVGVPVRKVAK